MVHVRSSFFESSVAPMYHVSTSRLLLRLRSLGAVGLKRKDSVLNKAFNPNVIIYERLQRSWKQ